VLYYSNKLCKEVGDFYSFLTLYIINYLFENMTYFTLTYDTFEVCAKRRKGQEGMAYLFVICTQTSLMVRVHVCVYIIDESVS
jgi:hypothetical protein